MKRWILVLAALALVAVGPAMADHCSSACGKMEMSGCAQMSACGQMSGCAQMSACGGSAACGQMPGCGGGAWVQKGRLHSSHDPSNIWYRGPAPRQTLLGCCSKDWGACCGRASCGPAGHPRKMVILREGKACGMGMGPCCGKCGDACCGKCKGAGTCCGKCGGTCGGKGQGSGGGACVGGAGMKAGCGSGSGCGSGAAIDPTSATAPGCGSMTPRKMVIRTSRAPGNSPCGTWRAGSWDTGWKKCNSAKRGGGCCAS